MTYPTMFIPRPVYDADFKFVDEDTKFIAEYLYNETNTTFSTPFPTGVIRTYRAFNDITIALTDYPCLKVYKTGETPFTNQSGPISTQFTIAYIIAFAQQHQPTTDVGTFVATELVRNLINASLLEEPLFQIDTRQNINIEYDTFVDPQNRIFKYSTITCNIFTTY